MHVFGDTFVVRARLDHVEERIQGVKRVADHYDALVCIELDPADAFGKVGLYDPNVVSMLAFTLHAHVF